MEYGEMQPGVFWPKFCIFISAPVYKAMNPSDDEYVRICIELEKANFIPTCPLPTPHIGEIFLKEYRRHFIIYADAILRCCGDDELADGEVKYAERYGIPIFTDVNELIKFFRTPEDASPNLKRFIERTNKSKQEREIEQMDLFGRPI